MDQQDHIATLCAAGTLGIAATGLALGVQTEYEHAYFTTPGKRKWPGASSLKSHTSTPLPSLQSRRVISQPVTSSVLRSPGQLEHSKSLSLLGRQSKRVPRPTTAGGSDAADSRGSSLNRTGLFRPRTADTRSTSERRDHSTSSSWLKRTSFISSPRDSSPSATSSKLNSTPQSTSSLAPESKDLLLPNKLVKRSTSQRALSNDHARGSFLKRPATSHQRSATVHEWMPCETSYSTPATPLLTNENGSAWRPFFERGYSRKRPTTANLKENFVPRTISASSYRQPTLLLGSQIDSVDTPNDQDASESAAEIDAKPLSAGRQRLKRSLSSVHRAARRRHATEPIVKVSTEAANGTITSTTRQSPLSPASQASPFDVHLPYRATSFNSSPPFIPMRHRFSFRKRQSMAPSDPTTVSSDNDTRVFTDDDSMEFQSDTAYDSLTTRATVSSHSASRNPKLDTVFHDPQILPTDAADATLARLVQKATLSDDMMDQYPNLQIDQLHGMGIGKMQQENDEMELVEESGTPLTPIKSVSSIDDDYNMTPVPQRLQYFGSPIRSSPPFRAAALGGDSIGIAESINQQRCTRRPNEEKEVVQKDNHNDTDKDDDDDDVEDEEYDHIDWSPKSDKQDRTSHSTLRQDGTLGLQLSPSAFEGTERQSTLSIDDDEDDDDDDDDDGGDDDDKRLSSIFDWSEHQKMTGDGSGGLLVRPKTVHGKQAHENSRSRSSGRKGPTQMHLRSQSVPNNRDPNAEPTPHSTSKFGTWGLGNKPVSEEWSDDFDFEDIAEDGSPQVSPGAFTSAIRGTPRGVKVPQAIIDRQASVHLQFGQVREFMLLVEELKNLRARGAALQLLETHSKQLWEDAESIIDLATINNEEDDMLPRPASPTSSDVFGDEVIVAVKAGGEKPTTEETKKATTAFRSVSSPATPPHGRPRGESLAHAKNFLQSIHQSRSGIDSSPLDFDNQVQRKLPFDTQDLKDLVVRSGVITRALKEIVRKAEGLSVSPSKTPPKRRDPAFSLIFNAPDSSPSPAFRNSILSKSPSANSYLSEKHEGSN